ncbi:hypothetical protein ACFRGK_06275 [Bacillus subtilis]
MVKKYIPVDTKPINIVTINAFKAASLSIILTPGKITSPKKNHLDSYNNKQM